jgi:hypothetical protein
MDNNLSIGVLITWEMKCLNQLFVVAVLLSFHACSDDPWDDDQYGDVCHVVKIDIPDVQTTTIYYDQHDQIYEMSMTGIYIPSIKMLVTYNNSDAFIDFYLNNTFTGSAEAGLDQNGNILNCIWYDSLGNELGEEEFKYNEFGNLIQVDRINIMTNTPETFYIEWSDGNAIEFTRTNGPTIKCRYFTGMTSSISLGFGNIALLIQEVDGNIAMGYSKDLLQTYDTEGIMLGEPISVEYELDSDDKARVVYWNIPSLNISDTTYIEYECHTK